MSDQPCAVLAEPINIPHITCTKGESTLDYYGPADASIAAEAAKYLARLTDGAEADLKSTIEVFLRATQSDCTGHGEEKRACWFTLRLTKRGNAFEVPRWHQDGPMYPSDEGREEVVRSKYAIALLGPPTLMLKPNEHVYATLRKGEAQHYWWREKDASEPSEEEIYDTEDKLREWLSNEFKDTPRVSVGHGEVVRFSWGRDDSPIHSEPDLVSDRVFMTVLYGSESELGTMCEWRNAQYGKYCVC
ncbi:hypothetical protein F53441_12954 [Fusarium austroafricanum]|uniref:Uncharacterized protein n=1 Tax=Fusarium austroafricanum TaxID=2364996 RepID=A0A8H4JVU2_9HYPO|nr:hypothetical protein F53441_12954 [Fusarium austroafricanum]